MWMASNNIDTQSAINKVLTYFRHEITIQYKDIIVPVQELQRKDSYETIFSL